MNADRKTLLLTATASAVLACLIVPWAEAAARNEQPNVLLILVDDKY